MGLFRHENRERSDATRRLYARYEIAHTGVDFLAALLFLVGSVLFFWETTQTAATWLFVFGSLAFAVKPTLRLAREVHLYRKGRMEPLEKAEKIG